ncbi:MAG: enoyl-CoA hydratase/isomerase family protein [Phycisphaerales bacterium]|nr:enoyl-CoA hydratase/isomerase family protein [Phycisphaerales bacterium]
MTDTAMAPLSIERLDDGGAIIALDAGDRPVVVMNRSLLARLDATLDELEADQASWLVLRSTSERSFVAGADLAEIASLDDEALEAYMHEGQRVFGRLAQWPVPVVAALGGAALGGGLELALHCHAIVVAVIGQAGKPWPIGLPEAGLGLCPAWGGTQLLAGRIDPIVAIEATTQGRPFKSDAMPDGLADRTLETSETLLEAACDLARTTTAAPPTACAALDPAVIESACEHAAAIDTPEAKAVIDCIRVGAAQGLPAGLEAERRNIITLRNSQETKDRIAAFLNRG